MRLLKRWKKKTDWKREDLENLWLNHEFNLWMKEHKSIYRGIREIISRLSKEDIEFFCQDKPIIFVPTTGHYSCAISHSYRVHVILILPELTKLLSSGCPEQGWSILAHEIGHIRYAHSSKNTSTLNAQIEADHFAFSVGLGRELENVLLQTPCIETHTRITYLASSQAELHKKLLE